MKYVTVTEALAALKEITESPLRNLELDIGDRLQKPASVVAQFIAEKAVSSAPKDNTGDPCPYCGEKLKTLVVEKIKNTEKFRIQISTTTTKRGLKNLVDMLKVFLKER